MKEVCLTTHRYFILHKPVNMVSQFVSSHAVELLTSIDFPFPAGTHAIGRLDNHSEGLLLLTTDKSITKKLFQGEVPHTRQYLVQVKHQVISQTIEQLKAGIEIRIRGGGMYMTSPCEVSLIDNPYDYIHPAAYINPYQVHSWLMITLTEGKYHQVRKMVDAAGHRCIRLIRTAIEQIQLGNLPPGKVKEMDQISFYSLLRIPFN